MIISTEKRKEFDEVAEPMIKWLAENFHPHVHVVTDGTGAELLEGVCSFRTDEHIRD